MSKNCWSGGIAKLHRVKIRKPSKAPKQSKTHKKVQKETGLLRRLRKNYFLNRLLSIFSAKHIGTLQPKLIDCEPIPILCLSSRKGICLGKVGGNGKIKHV